MVVAFTAVPREASVRERVDALAWDALRAIGELTTLANFATDINQALLIHERANEIRNAVLGCGDIALNKADRLCGQ